MTLLLWAPPMPAYCPIALEVADVVTLPSKDLSAPTPESINVLWLEPPDGIGYFCERTRRLLIHGILQCFRAAGFQNYRTKRRQHRGHSRLHSAFELRFGEPDDRAKAFEQVGNV